KPLDGLCQRIDAPEAVFYRRDDKILHIFALDAFCRGHMSDCFPITAVERKCNADLFLVVARDLEAIGAPSGIGALDGDLPVVSAFTGSSGMALKEQIMLLHHAVNTFGVRP